MLEAINKRVYEVETMIGAITGNYSYNNAYASYFQRQPAAQAANQPAAAQAANQTGIWTSRKGSTPELPVEPVRPVTPVNGGEVPAAKLGPILREGADPAEMAVRMRITPYDGDAANSAAGKDGAASDGGEIKVGAEGAQAAVEEGKCQTCEKRKYQDQSDDMGVSFQTPTNIAPEQAASAVRGHENEHVVREQAKARQEGRRVVSQSVTLHTDICPECGKVYISGGTTRTVTAAEKPPEVPEEDQTKQPEKGLAAFG